MRKQNGMSFLGFVVVAMVLGFAAVIVFRAMPVYSQYFSIKSTIARLAKESTSGNVAAIRDTFSKNAQIGYITDVDANDLKITQYGGTTRITVDYEKKVSLVANVSLLFEFSIDESSGKSVGN